MSKYSLVQIENTASGHPNYELRRSEDGVIVARINRYTGSKAIALKGTRIVRRGRERNFWRWSYERDHVPAGHRGLPSDFVESRQECVRSALFFLER